MGTVTTTDSRTEFVRALERLREASFYVNDFRFTIGELKSLPDDAGVIVGRVKDAANELIQWISAHPEIVPSREGDTQ